MRAALVAALLAAGCSAREELVATDLGSPGWRFVTLLGEGVPRSPADPDVMAVELGVRIRTSVAGEVVAVRFYRSIENPRGYIARLWSADGTLLASSRVPPDRRAVPGWRTALLPSRVPIAAGTLFVASYYTDEGRYEDDQYGLAAPIVSGPLTAPSESEIGANGVHAYGEGGGFPTLPWRASNYWVDVYFSPRP